MSRIALSVCLVLAPMLVGCSDDTSPPTDASSDAIAVDSALDAGDADGAMGFEPLAPESPIFTPCPAGWHEAVDAEDGLTACAPWPVDGPDVCVDRQMQLPGEPACRRVGPDCPASGFPEDLPAGATVVYVAEGASGGDGSRAAPFGSIVQGVSSAPDGSIVAIAPGSYPNGVRITRELTLWGACTDVVIDAMRDAGVTAVGADVTLKNLTVVGSTQGVWAFNGATIDAEAVVVDQADSGFLSFGTDASMTLTEVLVRGVRDAAFDASATSALTVREAFVVDSVGALLVNSGGTVQIEDLVARRIATSPEETAIVAVGLVDATVRIARASLEALGTESILVNGSTFELEDVVATYDPARAGRGTGLFVTEGGLITMDRVRLEGPGFQGLGVADPGSGAIVRDLVIRDVVAADVIGRGQGIEVNAGAMAALERVVIARANGVGILANGVGTTLALSDTRVDGTAPQESGTFGRALQVQQGASAIAQRFSATGNHEATIVGASPGTVVELVDLLVEDTRDPTCVGASCTGAGIGIGSYLGATVTARSFRVSRSALAGVQVAVDGQLDLSTGEVSFSPIGANVQVEGYDVDRLSADVAYRENGVNLDAAELPVPEPTADVGSP